MPNIRTVISMMYGGGYGLTLTLGTVTILLRQLNERYSADGLPKGAIRRSRAAIIYFTQNSQTSRRKCHITLNNS